MVVGTIANGFVKALVARTVANGFENVGFVVLGGDDFETIANGFISALVVGTVANGLGLWLSAVTTLKLSRTGSY